MRKSRNHGYRAQRLMLLSERFYKLVNMLMRPASSLNTLPRVSAKILVLGWYNRNNMGDDCYTEGFSVLFDNVTFACTDEITSIPQDVDIVICGGGDIINPFFMSKIRLLLRSFSGPCYAVSVGIPFACDAKYLSIFDHVFVRSSVDYQNAVEVIPSENVSIMPDLSWLLRQVYTPALAPNNGTRKRIGVSLAQPVFYKCIPDVSKALYRLVDTLCEKYDVHLLPFNTHVQSASECDYIINEQVCEQLAERVRQNKLINITTLKTRDDMMAYISGMDMMMCMRYHAVQYSLQARKPFMAMFTTKKVRSLLAEHGFQSYGYALPVDGYSKPVGFDVDAALKVLDNVVTQPNVLTVLPSIDIASICTTLTMRKRGIATYDPFSDENFDRVLCRAKQYLTHLLGGTEDVKRAVATWIHGTPSMTLTTLLQTACAPLPDIVVDHEAVAQVLCFAVTQRVSSPYVWGMASNIREPEFNAYAALEWVYGDCKSSCRPVHIDPPSGPITTAIDMSYFVQDDFKEFHRSGWSYCLTGLLRLDTSITHRRAQVMLDGYVDRTFMWGAAPLAAAGIVPYRKPWVGFVHHTFDESFGINNCKQLFQNKLFLQSLPQCKALIVLSKYLAAQMRAALDAVDCSHVSVEVLYHPMEDVPNKFTVAKFNNNPQRKAVHIGAWLRNPYAIYELPLASDRKNPLLIRKAILRGKNMNASAEPEWLMPFIDRLQYVRDAPWCDPTICRPIPTPHDGMCRPLLGADTPTNYHVAGMVDMLKRQRASVLVMEKLSNEEYDDLLSENVVFLNLVDASACNTVMECLFRHTPLIVNKHPAIVEILGDSYPGYYDNLEHAAELLGDKFALIAMHTHMRDLVKEPYSLDAFIAGFQEIVKRITIC